MITECYLFYSLFYSEIQGEKIKEIKKEIEIEIKAICERVYIRLSFPFKYCLHAEIIPANMWIRQVQDYYDIRFF